MLDAARTDRALGAIVGAAVGDALGAGYEFASKVPGLVPQMIGGGLGPFLPGEWTDDTSLTWCVLDGAVKGRLNEKDGLNAVAQNLADWFASMPPDIGNTTANSLMAAGRYPTAAQMAKGARAYDGITNGSLMRTAPVAVSTLDLSPLQCTVAARAVSMLTHSSEDATNSCAVWSHAIRHTILTGELDVRAGLPHMNLEEQKLEEWENHLLEAEVMPPDHFYRNGVAVTALQASWSSILMAGADFEESLYTAIRIGHDTDTVASITGALIGAYVGLDGIREDWWDDGLLFGYPNKTAEDLISMTETILETLDMLGDAE